MITKGALLQLSLLLSVFPLSILAAPKLAIDTTEYQAGAIDEAKTSFVQHTFTLKNTGDSILEISKLKLSCGCTTVKSDSVIPPHGIGHITMLLDMRKVTDVNFYLYVTFHTNDQQWPRAKIGVSGTLNRTIYFEPEAIVLPTTGKIKDTVQEVILRTAKNDLRVGYVSFVLDNPPVVWLASVPIKFTFDKNSSKGQDTIFTYRLRIFYTPVKGNLSGYGNFVVQTNHPDKPELHIGGVLDPLKQP